MIVCDGILGRTVNLEGERDMVIVSVLQEKSVR